MSDILIRADHDNLIEVYPNQSKDITLKIHWSNKEEDYISMPVEAAQAFAKELRKTIAIAKSLSHE